MDNPESLSHRYLKEAVGIPLKIISRKYKYKIIPINYYNRTIGVSKFKIKELGSMYLFTLLYCLLERILLKK